EIGRDPREHRDREMSHRKMIRKVCRTSPDLEYNASGIGGDSRDRGGHCSHMTRETGRQNGFSSFLSRGDFFLKKDRERQFWNNRRRSEKILSPGYGPRGQRGASVRTRWTSGA